MSESEPHEQTRRAFSSFARQLSASPNRAELIDHLVRGHEPDEHGWCRHDAHTLADHRERHPCTTVRLMTLIERTSQPS